MAAQTEIKGRETMWNYCHLVEKVDTDVLKGEKKTNLGFVDLDLFCFDLISFGVLISSFTFTSFKKL